jgi:hypothetical protein
MGNPPERILRRRIGRILTGLAISAAGALAVAGAYTEAHRAPDQS